MKHIKIFEKEIKFLYKSNRGLTELREELPDTLKHLYCYNNRLAELPELPDSLIYLDCSCNKLETLPKLPDKLEYLDCGYNELKILPKLPDTLTLLYCKGNHLPYDSLEGYKEWYFNSMIKKFNI